MRPPALSPSARHRIAVVLLCATAVLLTVTLSQLFVPGDDPRDTLGARAAGFGFSDRAHDTLFGVVPLALPLVASMVAGDQRGVHVIATVEYAVLLLIGVIIAAAAFLFGLDVGSQQSTSFGPQFIDTRAAVEGLVGDVTMLGLAFLALTITWRNWRVSRAPAHA